MSELVRLYQAWTLRILLVLTCVMIGAGGMGVAASMGLVGLLLLPIHGRSGAKDARQAAGPLIFLTAAIIWAGLSLAWSPYDRPDQIIKLALLTPHFALAAYAVVKLDNADALQLRNWWVVSVSILAVFFLFEAVSGSWLSELYKMQVEGVEDLTAAAILADRNLARGATAFLMLAGPVTLLLWRSGRPNERVLAGLIVVAAASTSIAFGVEANALAWIAAVCAGAVAWRFPHSALQLGFGFAGVMIIAAPFVMGALLSILPQSFIDVLPLSWAMRIEIWRFAMEQIALAPIMGQGLDASRVISDISTIRGSEFDRLPLHAHNAGLTIWIETGAVGALLFGGATIAAGQVMSRVLIAPAQAAALAYACTVFFVTVQVGSGIWQEWLHGALAFALAATALIRR